MDNYFYTQQAAFWMHSWQVISGICFHQAKIDFSQVQLIGTIIVIKFISRFPTQKPMRRISLILLLVCLFLPGCAPQNPTTDSQPSLALTDCVLPTASGKQMEARCGKLTVPEDRSNPSGRQIALNIALIPAIKRKPAPDPLFMLAGGPGQSAVKTFPNMLLLLNNIHEGRDIVLVDQRGTGESNPLRCLDPDNEEILSDEQVIEQLKTCPKRLDADVRFYTTEIAMQDLDAVRTALGYGRINLYGGSYGTRAGLTYLRMFPERVRTLTLDAVVDADFVMLMDAAGDGQKALDFFFARCAADAACQTSFPNLHSEFDELLKRLSSVPLEATIPHPITNKPLKVNITRAKLTNMIFNNLYSPDLEAILPLAIHTAYTKGDYAPLISQAYMLDAGLYDGMFYAVTCSEDAPLISAPQAEKLSQGSVFGNRTLQFVEVCASWPKGSVSAEFRAPVASDVPVLIFSGEADPITPPWHADKAAATLSNKVQLVFKGMGHGNLSSRCTTNLLKDFLDSASITGLDTSCVTGIKPPPFFVDFSGPRP
jgi:pimeloyl-ACP methyl ester carboxylesterase